jgi:hypothetical protein
LEFGPADFFEVAGSNAYQLVVVAERLEHSGYGRADLDSEIDGVGVGATTHARKSLREEPLKCRVLHAAESRGGAENANVSIAVDRNLADVAIASVDLAEGALEGPIVDEIAAVQQRAVDIEDVGVVGEPVGHGRSR